MMTHFSQLTCQESTTNYSAISVKQQSVTFS